jgi:predicted metal-binding protein
MQKIVSSYTHALIVQSTPPSKQFHQRLLDLEKLFLLHGYQEALAFGSGPCTACPSCPLDGDCRHPEFARPSMESCGVDVYETAQRAGLCLEPVRCASDYVRYIGMVLFKNREESCAFF